MPPQTKFKKITAQFLEQKILFHRYTNNKITCKIVSKMQCLENGL